MSASLPKATYDSLRGSGWTASSKAQGSNAAMTLLRQKLETLSSANNNYDAIQTICDFVEGGGNFEEEFIEAAFNRAVSFKGEHKLSYEYKLGRLFFVADRMPRAKQFLLRAPEQHLAKFDLSVIEAGLANGVPDLSSYRPGIHLPSVLEFALHRLTCLGRLSECFSFLTEHWIPPKQALPDSLELDPVFVCTMEKSGTTFLTRALTELTGRYVVKVDQRLGKSALIVPIRLKTAIPKGHLVKGHISAEEHNVRFLEKLKLPIFLQIRDPRDATWAWFRYIEEKVPIARRTFGVPWSNPQNQRAERIALAYESYFPHLVRWLASWKTFIEGHRLPVMISDYRKFASDNVETLRNLFAFRNAPISIKTIEEVVGRLREQAENNRLYNFRQGRADSWLDVMSPRISAVIDRHWDDQVLSYFGYER